MIEWGREIACDVNRAWSHSGFAAAAFIDCATQILQRRLDEQAPALAPDWEWLWRGPLPARQLDIVGGFADPQITLYEDPRMLVNLNLWRPRPTEVHDHGFCSVGAQLTGESLLFDFEARGGLGERIADGVYACQLELKGSRRLRPGDILTVPLGGQLIHQVFHLDEASVFLEYELETLAALSQSRSTYLSRVLAVAALEPSREREIRLRTLNTLLARSSGAGHVALASYLRLVCAGEAFAALSYLYSSRDPDSASVAIAQAPALASCASLLLSALHATREAGVDWERIQRRELRIAAAILQVCWNEEEIEAAAQQIHAFDLGDAAMQLAQKKLLGLRPGLLGMAVAAKSNNLQVPAGTPA